MRFDLYQIKAATATPAADKAQIDMMMDFRDHKIGGIAWDAWEKGFYTRVATLDAKDYNDAFEIGNIGPEENITRYGPMSSASVGNILIAEDGTIAVIANVGFIQIGYSAAHAA